MDAQHVIADRYSLAEPLPGSVTGLSWHAVDQWSGQQVVITRVPVSGLEDAELVRVRQEIAREIRVLSGLRHDRLARPIGVVPGHGDLWVVSELAPDVTMAGELRRRGTLGPAEVARWGADVADGLVAAHGAGVVHRNLSAGVVGIAADGRAVVSGFATTVLIPRNPRAGVPAHLAPEMAWGAPPSSASDIFALGAMLYSAVEGRDPFPAGDHVLAPPQRAGLLGDLLVPMMHPDPAQRPSAMGVA
ncbi:MAG TPA: protein kinase, partial [Pseudonocardiaceae bacterium]|nr:protein kinase [Pseudonocardiaceae bacterium]